MPGHKVRNVSGSSYRYKVPTSYIDRWPPYGRDYDSDTDIGPVIVDTVRHNALAPGHSIYRREGPPVGKVGVDRNDGVTVFVPYGDPIEAKFSAGSRSEGFSSS